MGQGILYVRSLYPGDIALPDAKAFELVVDDRLAVAAVRRHLLALTIKDFNNAIDFVTEGSKLLPKLRVPITTIDEHLTAFDDSHSLLCLIDYTRTDYRQYAAQTCSEILVCFDIADTDHINDKDYDFHDAVLKRFIQTYRHVSQDVSVSMPERLLRDIPTTMISIIVCSEDELTVPARERLRKPRELRFGIRQVSFGEFTRYLPKHSPQRLENTSAMEARFKVGVPCDESYDGLLRAFEELSVNENPKWALLDAFMVTELAVARFVNEAKIAKGVSKKKLAEYRRDIGISYMLNVDLPLLLCPLTIKEGKTLQDVDTVRTKRNKVVHEGAPVSKEEALHAINAAKVLLDMFHDRSVGRLDKGSDTI
jgi:hypothetical protein